MRIPFIALLFICLQGKAQEKLEPTNRFTVDGKVKSSFEITLQDLQSMPSEQIDSFVVKNLMMQKKYTMVHIEGILLKNILSKAVLNSDDPKQYSQYYFVLIASDNYKVVYSWNELFNSPTGDHVYIVKAVDGRNAFAQNDAICTICTTDQATGRRYLKALKEILVERVNEK